MGQARLTRIDAAGEMVAAVDAFRNEANAVLESLDMEIRRALEWIHHDRHDHWNHEVRRGWDRITEARIQLQQAMTARRIGNHDPACIDEKKALARAKQRLEIAQQKVEAVRHCAREIDRAVDEYRGARTPLSGWLETEAPKALAVLRRMMDHLEEYLAIHTPGGGSAGTTLAAGIEQSTPTALPDAATVNPDSCGELKSTVQPFSASSDGAAVNPGTIGPANPAGGAP